MSASVSATSLNAAVAGMIASEAMGEAASLVEGFDAPGGSFLEMITATLFLGPVHAAYGNLIAGQRYEPAGFKTTLG